MAPVRTEDWDERSIVKGRMLIRGYLDARLSTHPWTLVSERPLRIRLDGAWVAFVGEVSTVIRVAKYLELNKSFGKNRWSYKCFRNTISNSSFADTGDEDGLALDSAGKGGDNIRTLSLGVESSIRS